MHGLRRHRLASALAAVSIAAASPQARAQGVVDLDNLGTGGFRIDGDHANDLSGRGVSGAGDVNGDGLADLIVGAAFADNYVGESFVVFGKPGNAAVNLGTLGADGFRIDGAQPNGRLGYSVSGAGDVNGDGLADLIVGAHFADSTGESYVVFGKPDSAAVDLANLGLGGFRIDGVGGGGWSGYSVSGAGDVNGDDLDDLIVGAQFADSTGDSYVVFGKPGNATVDLGNLGTQGFRIDGVAANNRWGFSVSGAGDVNGDGLADLIVGARSAGGQSYVVFGKTGSAAVDLASLGAGGFLVDGPGYSGFSVSGAGDVNGDGLADLIIGDSLNAGAGYVVFGKAGNAAVDLASLGTGGFPIGGAGGNVRLGFSVSGAGDVNGDGLADLILGAPYGYGSNGADYVVFGKPGSAAVDLGNLGAGGFRISSGAGGVTGMNVSGAGDVNGDGLADLIVATPYDVGNQGDSYVVFSPSPPPPPSVEYRARGGNGDPPRLAVGTSGDGSNASHPDARVWIDFDDGTDLLGLASTELVDLTRSAGSFGGAAANVSWRVRSNRLDYTSFELRFRYLDSELLIGNESLLQLVYSPNGVAPFTPLVSVVNAQDNTISAVVTQTGYFYLGQVVLPDPLFANGFE